MFLSPSVTGNTSLATFRSKKSKIELKVEKSLLPPATPCYKLGQQTNIRKIEMKSNVTQFILDFKAISVPLPSVINCH